MSECTSCRGPVAREVVGVKGFRANLDLITLAIAQTSDARRIGDRPHNLEGFATDVCQVALP